MGVVRIPYVPIRHEKVVTESGNVIHTFVKDKTFASILKDAGVKYLEMEE